MTGHAGEVHAIGRGAAWSCVLQTPPHLRASHMLSVQAHRAAAAAALSAARKQLLAQARHALAAASDAAKGRLDVAGGDVATLTARELPPGEDTAGAGAARAVDALLACFEQDAARLCAGAPTNAGGP